MSQQPGGAVDRRLKIEIERTASRSHVQQNDRLDVLGVWLLLLFVAVFFGIAAEEARKPSLFATSQSAATGPSMPLRMLMGTETPANKEEKEPTKEPRK
ncbi:MAG: hypothetical protein IPJ84_14575 [Bdellovibrionales bacterium]|nr:hypothetical protein [Bdellovibrionales bacterium]